MSGLCLFLIQPDDEPDPEERDHFLQQLYKFMEDRGNVYTSPVELINDQIDQIPLCLNNVDHCRLLYYIFVLVWLGRFIIFFLEGPHD